MIANRGEPVARLVPVRKRSGRQSQASSESIVAWLARHPLPAHAIGSAADIDAAIAAERDAWE